MIGERGKPQKIPGMRCGDVYKISALLKEGRTDEQIVAYFANSYAPTTVQPFLEVAKAAMNPPKPKRRRAKPKPEVTDGDSDLDL